MPSPNEGQDDLPGDGTDPQVQPTHAGHGDSVAVDMSSGEDVDLSSYVKWAYKNLVFGY